jgi:hypothetical protein
MVSLQLSLMSLPHVAAYLACGIVFSNGIVSEGVLVLTQCDCRCRSTSRDISERAQESSATRPMFCPAEGQIRRGWILSSSSVLIAGISTHLPAASSRISTVSDGRGVASRRGYTGPRSSRRDITGISSFQSYNADSLPRRILRDNLRSLILRILPRTPLHALLRPTRLFLHRQPLARTLRYLITTSRRRGDNHQPQPQRRAKGVFGQNLHS